MICDIGAKRRGSDVPFGGRRPPGRHLAVDLYCSSVIGGRRPSAGNPLANTVSESEPNDQNDCNLQHWERANFAGFSSYTQKAGWNRMDPPLRQTIKSHLAYVNLTDALFKQTFYQFQRTVAKRVRRRSPGARRGMPIKPAILCAGIIVLDDNPAA